MTEPPDDEQRNAREEVDQAMEQARNRLLIGSRLAERWRQSRDDNNFRAMLRQLAEGQR